MPTRTQVSAFGVTVPTLIAAAALIILASMSAGQSGDRRNAATWYALAMERYQTVLPRDAETWNRVIDFEVDPSSPVPPELRQALHRLQPTLNLTRRASHQPFWEVHIESDAGLFAPRPHLRDMRTLIRALHYDFLVRLHDQDVHGAMDRLATMYRMTPHATGDSSVVGSLVSNALFHFAENRMQHALEHGVIGPQEAALLLRAFEQYDAHDPFHLKKAFQNERQSTTEWMIEHCSGEGGLERLLGAAEEFYPVPEMRTALRDMTQAEFEHQMHRTDLVMGRICDAYLFDDRDEAAQTLAKIQQEIEAGEHGALAATFYPAQLARTHKLLVATADAISSRRQTLREIADGTRDPMEQANAAVWYSRAFAAMEKIEPDRFALVRRYAASPTAPANDELSALLDSDEIRAVLDLLRTASQIDRCKFSHAWWPNTVRRCHTGMRDAGRLLAADAGRLIHQRDLERIAEAAERLSIGYRMCDHFARDTGIVSAIIAHRNFRGIDAVAEAALDGRDFDEAAAQQLARSLRFRSVDPFGYEAALAALRDGLPAHIYLPHNIEDETYRKDAREFVRGLGDERLLWLEVTLDQSVDFWRREQRQADQWLAHLEDVLDAEAFRAAMNEAYSMRARILSGEFTAVTRLEPPMIAPVSHLRAEAHEDLRRCLQRHGAAGREVR